MKSKGEAGEHLCTNPPYGYMKDPENKKRWIVDEEAAEVVKRIFSLCLFDFKAERERSLRDTFYPRCGIGTGRTRPHEIDDCLCC